MIHVKVDQLLLSNVGFAIILKSLDDERSLPIVIGAAEAQSIAIFINKVEIPRPLTHDLLKSVLDFLECRLIRIEIHKLEQGTFFADLVLEQDGKEVRMDARPSDSVALALRCNAQIFVHKSIMDEAGIILSGEDVSADVHSPKDPQAPELSSPLQRLQEQLRKAIDSEHYEEAAKLRDEIKRLEKTHTKN